MNYRDMLPVAEDLAEVMKTLAHPSRLMALCAMMDEEVAVGQLAEAVGLRPQAMSQQLAILRNKGLVTTRREGQTIYYALADDQIRQLMQALYQTYCLPAQS
ncbi:metalloregulator ArsR/SmtB family transcription factor [Maricaulis sp.]|uniref:ArsR/SmtB family transcription factor n=1 Tax=Maricaulis sp. TaxID=1486257 RepID=UPI00262252FD|nr:metalloregulator ArsR/SmtB family transcription factor [Maricaulis sp.]